MYSSNISIAFDKVCRCLLMRISTEIKLSNQFLYFSDAYLMTRADFVRVEGDLSEAMMRWMTMHPVVSMHPCHSIPLDDLQVTIHPTHHQVPRLRENNDSSICEDVSWASCPPSLVRVCLSSAHRLTLSCVCMRNLKHTGCEHSRNKLAAPAS